MRTDPQALSPSHIDTPGVTLAPRRARHALHTAFRTVDAADYSEIVTVDADRRAVLDLALDAATGLAAVITVDASDGHASSARVYEIGRGRAQVGNLLTLLCE